MNLRCVQNPDHSLGRVLGLDLQTAVQMARRHLKCHCGGAVEVNQTPGVQPASRPAVSGI